MGLAYRKKQNHGEGGYEWGSYTDLFANLSLIFLTFFAVSNLRMGASVMEQMQTNQHLTQKVEDLQQQIKVYNALKDEYLQKEASQAEQETYTELMDKLNLLQDEAKTEKESLRQQALENEKKEKALNKYQQVIRNIINANMVANSRIKHRDDIIEENKEEIKDLETTVSQKRAELNKKEKQIATYQKNLDEKMQELQESYKSQEITKKSFEKQAAKLKEESRNQLKSLEKQKQAMEEQLADLSAQASKTKKDLENTKYLVAAKAKEAEALKGELEGKEAEFEGKKAEFEGKLGSLKGQLSAKEKEYASKMAGLEGKYQEKAGEVAKLKAIADAKKNLAREIAKNLKNAGVKAEVDPNNGDVTLDFGDHYFDTGRTDLNPQMRGILEKALPSYASGLFDDSKLADKISSVEIVGFASPTYKGKFVDPETLSPEDRKAVDFNLDLSYGRAKSIFQHVFDTNKMTFKHQRKMLPLVKVTGRSFLSEAKNFRIPTSNGTEKDFCKKYDCKKAQRVLIKFTLKEHGE